METQHQRSVIEKLLFSFSTAFNAADIANTVASFTPDGINMPNNGPLAQGTENLIKAFGALFNMAEINIEYNIDETVVSGDYAFVRTNSTVKTIFKASREQVLLKNKELFILRNYNEEWKISHYIFNNTQITK